MFDGRGRPIEEPRIARIVRHPQFSDSVQPAGGWVRDPADKPAPAAASHLDEGAAEGDSSEDEFNFNTRQGKPRTDGSEGGDQGSLEQADVGRAGRATECHACASL